MLLLILPALVAGCAGGPGSIRVNLSSLTAQPLLQPGTAAQISISPALGGFRGSINLSQTSITFTDASGNAKSSAASAQSGSNTITLSFTVPALAPTAPTTYQVTVQGSTSENQTFSSLEPLSATVYPAAVISSVAPNFSYQGQSVTVALTGLNTNFAQGQTQATFGAGIAVNGAGAGLPGLINVTGAGAATANLVISSTATIGPRDVVVTTQGQTAALSAGFSVQAALLPLVASAGGPYSGFSGRVVTFNGSQSNDPNGLTLTYAWTFGDGTTGTGATPTHTYTKAGTYTVQLTVSDSAGLTATASTTATVTTLTNPTATAGGPYTGTTGQAISFNGSGTDPNGSALTYAWTFGDGASGTGASPTHTYATAGTYTATLTVTDTYSLTGSATATVTVANPIQPPVAQAGGPYTGTAGTAVSFNGSASSDPQGQTLNYSWDFGDGTTGSGVKPTHTYANAGSYTVRLTVTDTSNLTNTASTTATIAAAPKAPTANAGGPYTGVAGTAVSFNGSASSDPQGQTLTYAWVFGDGTNGTGATPTHTYTAAGTYTATLTVTDTANLTGTATAAVTITAATKAPTANAGGPYTGVTGTAVTFNGSASTDPQGQTLTYAWAFGDGTNGTGATPTHTYATAGTYTATLTVTDTANLTGSATATVTIAAAPKAPTANAGGPYTGVAGTAVSFDGAASIDPQGQTLTYAWAFGDGTSGTGATPTHTYATAGTYTATLTVTDTANLTGTATATVTITAAPKAPTANAGGPYTGVVGAAVTFNGSASTDPQGQTLTYAWAFGDGANGTGATPTHTYATAGTYTATLTVTDTANLTATAIASVTITAASKTPTANAGGPYTGSLGVTITFNGSSSSDPNQETLTYAWTFGDGGTATGVAPTYTYTDSGTYTVTLTVTNTDGLSATATTTATISTVLQAIQAAATYTGNVGQSLAFNGNGSTAPGSDSLTYAWTFGDGSNATGAQVNHTYASAGTYNVILTVTDTSTNLTNSSTSAATITAPPQLSFTAPAQGALFNTTTVQVTGTAASSVQSVSVNGISATLSSGTFTATIPVRAGVNILTATGTDTQGNVGTASTSVTIDLTPPIVSVLQPPNKSTVTAQQINVAGMVTDQVTGTVNSNNVTVTVNGQAASVSNRSFMLPNLVLVPGLNTLTLVATDAAGNSSTSTVQVTYANAAAQQHIVILSGNNQSGTISSVLPQPLAVQLVSPTGTPVPNRAVTFTVTASDGNVESLPLQSQTLNLTTDAQGKASVLFQLGSRAGLGINQVTVSSPGFTGGTVFTETTTAGPAAYIHEFLGNNQRGIIGQPLAQAFQVIVQDSGGDPIAGVPVTYTINSGDGTFAGQATTTVTTNSDGRALATLTLGQQEGINNNTVTVDFPNDPNSPVNFYASGFSSGAAANTSVSGIVLDNTGNPVPNATASLLNTSLITTTDANGHFVLSPAPVGTVTLLVDGSTTSLSETLPSLSFLLQALPGQNNTLNMPVYLPVIDTQSARTVGGSTPATLTMTSLPGVALTVAPNSVTFPDGSHVGQLTISQVKTDLIPMPPPNGIVPAFAWTIQPAGTVFSTPVAITIPNTQGLPPGQVQEFYQYDHDLEQFVSAGTMRVSPDGSVLNSDPGFGITKAGWANIGSSPPPGACGNSCDDNNVCTSDSQNTNCSCNHVPKSGGCGNNPPPGANNCQQPGMCVKGSCSSKPKPFGTGCNDNQFCTTNDICQADGACRGTMKPDQILPLTGFQFQANLDQTAMLLKPVITYLVGSQASNNFNVNVAISGQNSNQCCEAQKTFLPNSNATYSFSGGISSLQAFLDFPPWSLPFGISGGGYGLSANVSLTLSGQVGVNVNQCAVKKCGFSSVALSSGINLFLGANLTNPDTGATIAAAQFQVPIQVAFTFQTSGDCQGFDYSFGTQPITISFNAQYPGGAPFQFNLWTPVGATTFAMGNIQIPQPLQ